MESMQIEISGDNDRLAHVLSFALGDTFGSLRAGVEAWRDLLDAMPTEVGGDDADTEELLEEIERMLAAATALTVAAVPKEGYSNHPIRAVTWLDDSVTVGFETPGGVDLRCSRTSDGVSLAVDFGRDSKDAATQLAFRLWRATGSQQAAQLLSECSAELAAANVL